MKKEDKDILDLAKERYKIACEGWDDVYKEASNDLKFVYDIDEGQWPPQIRAARERDGRPVTTVNKLQKFVRQLRGDLQQNRPRVKVIPVDDKGDVQMAELYSGLIRQIEYLSSAEIAYDTGYMHAVSCSVGYFRLITQFGENSFDQDIYIKRILNPLSVRLDPSAVEFTFEDAKYGFIEELVDKKEFKKLYPKAAVTDFEGKKSLFGDWLYKDKVRVVEYFYKEPVEKKLVQLSTREVIELGGEVTKEDIEAKGFTIAQERTEQTHQVKWCRMNGAEVLEKADWAGKYIPIIPVLGDEIVVEGKKYYLSLARGAKGPQEMYNYWADLSIKTMICTPNGWDTLENIHIGDSVFDEKGKPCKVIGESPTLNKEKSYKVMFSNGSFVVASADHLWTVNRGSECGKVIQTRDIDIDNDSISLTEPLDLPEKELKIPPYVLGLWLSDGNSRYTEIFAHKKTVDELAGYLVADGCILSPKRIACKETETYGLYMRGIRKYFVNYGLLNNKHIPTDYLRASHMQRLELLRGLMDGDGSCRSGHQVRFASKSNQLASDFSELLYTLGLKGNYNQDKDGINHFYFTAYMPVFKLKYKLERQITGRKKNEKQSCRYRIVFIEEIEGIPTKCITVDSPNSLFLAGDGMIPTHNTSATETVALAPKSPFMVDHRQIKGFENEWEEANTTNRMYIRYNAIAGLEKPQRERQTEVPSAIMAMMQQAAFDIEDHLGRYEATKGQKSNERSGKAILARIAQADKGTYTFVDNLTRAIVYAGRQIIDLIPKIYDTQRALTIMGEDGEQSIVQVNVPELDGMGNAGLANDLSVGKYDLIASVGASFGSKRQETVAMMLESMQYAPAIAHIISPLIFKYADFPGAQEIYAEIKTQVEKMQEGEQGGNKKGPK